MTAVTATGSAATHSATTRSAATRRAATRRAAGVGARPAAATIALYLLAMPFLAGLPRGTGVPVLRPSELLQILVTVAGVSIVVVEAFRGRRWRLHLRRTEGWLMALAVAGSIMPLLWLLARGETIGTDQALAAFPFLKYVALYLLARAAVATAADARLVMYAMVVPAMAVAALAVVQSLGFGPVVDILGQYFISSDADIVDGGRATTTIGSSIATGSYLAITCGVAIAWASARANLKWFAVSAVLAVGALASGQTGTVLALAVILIMVGKLTGRSRQLLAWGVPMASISVIALWPIVAARLADVDQGYGLPESWVVRWANVTKLFWPDLVGGGWFLGVSPDAILDPPDVWRDAVYLESGYLWLLWVGGIPLVIAALGFLRSVYRDLSRERDTSTATGLATAGQAATMMIGLLMVFDPHLTMRAGADVFFVLIAIAVHSKPFATPDPLVHRRWQTILGSSVGVAARPAARIQLAEVDVASVNQRGAVGARPRVESAIAVLVADRGRTVALAEMGLHRHDGELHGTVSGPVTGDDDDAIALLWRGLVLCSQSLRLRSLIVGDGLPSTQRTATQRELIWAAELAAKLEHDRLNGPLSPPVNERPVNMQAIAADGRNGGLPAIRLVADNGIPTWKRSTDLLVGGLLLVATAPLWSICALLVKWSSPGPVFFRQLRIGSGGLPFQMYKFRTMYVGNDDSAQRDQNRRELLGEADAVKDAADIRITSVGRWLRRLSLDELPQLLNIVRGEMSVVGPRPSLIWEVELFEPAKRRRLDTRPGLTGLWQISGRADVSMSEMLELDLDYLDTMSPRVDLRCLVGTAKSIMNGSGAR